MSALGFGLAPDQLADVFPFHVVFGRDLRIQQVGRSWATACPAVAVGAAFDDVLRLVRPSLPPTFEHVAAHPRAIFLLACQSSGLVLRGQMTRLHDDALAFLGGFAHFVLLGVGITAPFAVAVFAPLLLVLLWPLLPDVSRRTALMAALLLVVSATALALWVRFDPMAVSVPPYSNDKAS